MHLPTNETVRGPAASMLGRVALLATLAALFLPAAASAADSIYWGNEGSGTVQFGNLDGTGSVGSLFGGESAPCGVAIDSAAGKIYWANFNGNDPGREPRRHGRDAT